MLPQSFIQQVKEATNIVDLVGKYTELKLVGHGIYQGKCPHPNHNDSTPSFRVWEKEQSWACMGCHYGKKNKEDHNYGSDCFAFVQWIENISWFESVKKLAEDAGLQLPEDNNQETYDLNHSLAESYYKDVDQVYDYLIARGLDDQDISNWLIGFDGSRITFPLFDRYKNILGFSRRIFNSDDDVPKYKNSPNSKIFNKGSYLYGLQNFDTNFEEIRITEGSMDVILAAKHGVKNIVATLGTAFTDHHVELIRHFEKIPVFCMDGDPAGLKSIQKSVAMLADAGIYSKILILPSEMDMADLSNTLQDRTEQYIEDESVTYGLYQVQGLLNQYDAKMTETKLKIYPEVTKILNTVPDSHEKQILLDFIKEKMSIDFTKDVL